MLKLTREEVRFCLDEQLALRSWRLRATEDLLALRNLLNACAAVDWEWVLGDVIEGHRQSALSKGKLALDDFLNDVSGGEGVSELQKIRDLTAELRTKAEGEDESGG